MMLSANFQDEKTVLRSWVSMSTARAVLKYRKSLPPTHAFGGWQVFIECAQVRSGSTGEGRLLFDDRKLSVSEVG